MWYNYNDLLLTYHLLETLFYTYQPRILRFPFLSRKTFNFSFKVINLTFQISNLPGEQKYISKLSTIPLKKIFQQQPSIKPGRKGKLKKQLNSTICYSRKPFQKPEQNIQIIQKNHYSQNNFRVRTLNQCSKIGLIGWLILIVGSPCNITFSALIMRSGA